MGWSWTGAPTSGISWPLETTEVAPVPRSSLSFPHLLPGLVCDPHVPGCSSLGAGSVSSCPGCLFAPTGAVWALRGPILAGKMMSTIHVGGGASGDT